MDAAAPSSMFGYNFLVVTWRVMPSTTYSWFFRRCKLYEHGLDIKKNNYKWGVLKTSTRRGDRGGREKSKKNEYNQKFDKNQQYIDWQYIYQMMDECLGDTWNIQYISCSLQLYWLINFTAFFLGGSVLSHCTWPQQEDDQLTHKGSWIHPQNCF